MTTLRALKFRAWNTRHRLMEYIEDLYWFEENSVHANGDNDYVLTQYTGKQDPWGTNIYEGDIIQDHHFHQAIPSPMLIGAVFYDDSIGSYSLGDCYDLECTTTYEVIGNIYQHPELLGT